MLIGVLLNHDQPHQVPHVVPFALALSALRPQWSVHILCSGPHEEDFSRDIASLYPDHRCVIERLKVPLSTNIIEPLLRPFVFYRKYAVQRANLNRFAQFDALIVPELTSLALRNDHRTAGVKLIFTGHGVGDGYNQNIGMFDPRIEEFDLVLFPGKRIVDELEKLGRLRHTPHAIVGYPKFELARNKSPGQLFDNDRPTVLFNPTQNKLATCWHRFGTDVLDFFQQSNEFNLIFAPHVLLFKRALSRGSRLPRRYKSNATMLVDTGSRACMDMTYLDAADIYLGDLSSQIYEFINTPRPCVFLNALGADYRDNPAFRSWSFGPVIDDIGQLAPALKTACENFHRYAALQKTAAEENFADDETPASKRGAEAIAAFLEAGTVAGRDN